MSQFPDKNISALPLRKTFYGQIPRTAEEMYTHTKNVNSYYFGEIGVDADNEGNILECRRRGFELLEKMPGFPDNLMQEGSYGEMWSVRKVLRRFVWHDRIHAKAMWRMAKKTFDVEVENFLFLRGRKMNREIYASDGEYTLLKIAADDRDNYIELHRQLNGEQSLFLNPHCKDMMWKYVLEEEDNITYSIFDSYGEYCGSVELQHYKENIPEIGIELLEKKRNKGIAAKVVKLLAKRAYMDKKVDFFLIRISSKNEHSRHVFEKMGVIPIGSKESNFKKFINTYLENIKNIYNGADIQDIIEPYLNICNDLKEEVIYEYKLIPELFL